jgi:uncharacterized protein (TIGR03435 family)
MSNGLSRPLIDKTGLSGSFDFTFLLPAWNREEGPLGDHVVSNVFPELHRQLGLRVQGATALIDVLMVDHVEAPTAN